MIEVKNITKKYGNFYAVDDISFEVKDNEVVGFLGVNGAGKSTTMNMITGYIEPTKGRIYVNGYDISKQERKAKREIGYMPEGVPLYLDLTVKEFLNYMADLKYVKRKDKKQHIDTIMEETGLTEVQNKIIKNISRGYRQRVSFAGSLIGNPKVLILDEPTVGLDPKQVAEIRNLIKRLGKNHTVILSSHILSEISQICEKVIIINKGKLVTIDTPENLEEKTKGKNSVLVTIEDNDKNIDKVKKNIKNLVSMKLLNENEDGTKKYEITLEDDVDARKIVSKAMSEVGVSVFELKKNEPTLEDAFLKIISDTDNEIKKDNIEKNKEKTSKKEELSKMTKEERKVAKKEEKAKDKIARKENLEKEWEDYKKVIEDENNRKKEKKENSKREKEKIKSEKSNNKKIKKKKPFVNKSSNKASNIENNNSNKPTEKSETLKNSKKEEVSNTEKGKTKDSTNLVKSEGKKNKVKNDKEKGGKR